MSEVSSVREGLYAGDERLTNLERILMLVPLLSALVFGILPYLATGWFANLSGYPGNDHYIYRLAGAATLGYVAGLGGALADGRWAAIKLPLIATLSFSIALLIACLLAMAGGYATTAVYLLLLAALFSVAISAFLLYNHRSATPLGADVAQWATYVVLVLAVADIILGLVLLFVGAGFGSVFGYKATDVFLYSQAGAATFGFGVMEALQLRFRAWAEWQWAVVMAAAFNALVVLASLWSIYKSSDVDPLLLPLLLAVSCGAATVVLLLIIQREGK